MSRLLGGTLERVCKAVLLLCLLHFLVAVILYFDVYAQHLAFFSRFSARGPAHALHPAASSSSSSSNCSRPNATASSSGLPEVPSALPGPTAPTLPPCPDSPPGLAGAEGEPRRAHGRPIHTARLHPSPDGGGHHPL
uniref:Beta-1,4-galactosyltransferase 2 n=1 Tax=Homo sapiens TaxID=9606 RepID=A0A7I2V6C7_HUMAN